MTAFDGGVQSQWELSFDPVGPEMDCFRVRLGKRVFKKFRNKFECSCLASMNLKLPCLQKCFDAELPGHDYLAVLSSVDVINMLLILHVGHTLTVVGCQANKLRCLTVRHNGEMKPSKVFNQAVRPNLVGVAQDDAKKGLSLNACCPAKGSNLSCSSLNTLERVSSILKNELNAETSCFSHFKFIKFKFERQLN